MTGRPLLNFYLKSHLERMSHIFSEQGGPICSEYITLFIGPV